jgi:hypothetical protein
MTTRKSSQADLRRAANDNWPLVLTRHEAAEMCAISETTFGSWVRKKILPGPIPGARRWSRNAIERSLASVADDQLSPLDTWLAKHARQTERA